MLRSIFQEDLHQQSRELQQGQDPETSSREEQEHSRVSKQSDLVEYMPSHTKELSQQPQLQHLGYILGMNVLQVHTAAVSSSEP